jgi:hypothetical protein
MISFILYNKVMISFILGNNDVSSLKSDERLVKRLLMTRVRRLKKARIMNEKLGQKRGRWYMSYFRGSGADSNCRGDCDGMMAWWIVDTDGKFTGKISGGVILPDIPSLTNTKLCLDANTKGYVCQDMKVKQFNWESADHDCCGWDRRELGAFKATRLSDNRMFYSRHMFDDTACPKGCEFGHSFYPFIFEVNNEYSKI